MGRPMQRSDEDRAHLLGEGAGLALLCVTEDQDRVARWNGYGPEKPQGMAGISRRREGGADGMAAGRAGRRGGQAQRRGRCWTIATPSRMERAGESETRARRSRVYQYQHAVSTSGHLSRDAEVFWRPWRPLFGRPFRARMREHGSPNVHIALARQPGASFARSAGPG